MRAALPFFPLALLFLFTCSCNKQHEEKPIDLAIKGYKIKLVQGNNQQDTTGNILRQSIVCSYTYDGDTISNGYIRFEQYNCDGEPQVQEFQLGKTSIYYPENEVEMSYPWRLNSTVGIQYMKAVLLDSLKIPQDSVMVTATGLAPAKGWYISGCLFNGAYNYSTPVSFCQPSSSKILMALNAEDYPYYSEDEGASWHVLPTLPQKMKIRTLLSTPQNEVFLAADDYGIYYSADGGATWHRRTTGLTLQNFYGNVQYTKSGLLFCTTLKGVFYSQDKGLHWQAVETAGLWYGGFYCVSSLTNGTLLAVHDHTMQRSTDGGVNWSEVYTISSTSGINYLFVDDNDDVYAAMSTGLYKDYGLYRSRDGLKTWTKVFTPPSPAPYFDASITAITKQNGVYYFYVTSKNILTSTTDFVNYTTLDNQLPDNGGRNSETYIVTQDNHYLLSKFQYGVYYYIP